jgi:hypothetical protein
MIPLRAAFCARDDMLPMRLRTSFILANTAANLGSYVIMITPFTVATPGYISLGNIFPALVGLASSYSKCMVTKLDVQATMISPLTAGGYVALGYEATSTSTTVPPTTLLDVTTNIHSDVAQVTESAVISVDVSQYFNDWQAVENNVGVPGVTREMGAVQLRFSNSLANTIEAVIVQIEIDFYYAGYRSV